MDREATLKQAQRLAQIGSWELNLADGSFQMSDEMCRIYGITEQSRFDNIQSLIDEAVHPDDREMIYKSVKSIVTDFGGEPLTYRIIRPDGEIRWIAASQPEVRRTDKDNKPIVMMGVLQDITDHKLVENALHKRTYELRERVKELNCLYSISQLVDNPNISIEKIMQGIVDLIPAGWQYPENTCARIIIDNQDFTNKDFKESIWKLTSNIIVHEKPVGTLDVFYKEEKPDDNEGPFLKEEKILINAIAERLGRIVERKQAEEALRESEERYRTAIEYSNDGITIIKGGRDIYVNQKFVDIFGYNRPEELLGKPITMTVHPDDRNRMIEIDRRRQMGESFNARYEFKGIRKDGKTVFIEGSATQITHGGEPAILAFLRDITKRKQAEEHIHYLTQELLKVQESERHRIARDLHDKVAQDLSSSKILTETLIDNQPNIPNEIRQKISELSLMLKKSIKAVRDLAYDMRPSGLDQLGLVQTIYQYCEDFSAKNSIAVDFFSAGMDNIQLDFDTEINLYRLIQEGLNNIKKHAEASQITIRLVASSPNIILRIEDNGNGFDVEGSLIKALNEKHMGLKSMEERASLLKGNLKIQSRLMQGTKIFIEVPYKEKVSV